MTGNCVFQTAAVYMMLFLLTLFSYCYGHNCSSNLDCSSNESCCNTVCSPDRYCLGYTCSSPSDCGVCGRCCAIGTTPMSGRKCRKNCIGDYCNNDVDCGRQLHCCGNICSLENCHGKPCERNSDCGNNTGLLCYFKVCSWPEDCEDSSEFAVILVSILTLLVALSFLVHFFFRQTLSGAFYRLLGHFASLHRGTQEGVLPPYPGEDQPPSYQTICSDYPPPLYEQPQTYISSLGRTETLPLIESPPPYRQTTDWFVGKGSLDQGLCEKYWKCW